MLRRVLAIVAFYGVMAGGLVAEATHRHAPKLRSVPELDGSMAALAIALIGGGLAVVHGRRRRARR